MGIFSREVTLPFSFLPSFSMGVSSQKKEFAPIRANSFLEKLTHLRRACSFREMNMKTLKLYPFVKYSQTCLKGSKMCLFITDDLLIQAHFHYILVQGCHM